jgi:hypothetical protein
MFHITSVIIKGSIVALGLGGPVSLFELSQPGHFVNKYYWELHPTSRELSQQNLSTTTYVNTEHRSAIAEAPVITIPTATIVAVPPQ